MEGRRSSYALALSLLVAVQEAIELLAARGVIDAALGADLARVVAVRHRIAHGYVSVDLPRLWEEVPAGLDALDRYAAALARFIDPAR